MNHGVVSGGLKLPIRPLLHLITVEEYVHDLLVPKRWQRNHRRRIGTRTMARQAQHEASYIRTLPIRLLGPLVGSSLPAFVYLAIVPPLAALLAGLSSGPLSTL